MLLKIFLLGLIAGLARRLSHELKKRNRDPPAEGPTPDAKSEGGDSS